MNEIVLTDGFIAHRHLEFGIAHLRQNSFYEAIYEFDRVLELDPNDRYAHWNKATALLSLGDYDNGLKEHDWGWKLFSWRGFGPVGDDMDRLSTLPMWQGESLEGKNLLIYHELGFGDAIMTLRYLPTLRDRAKFITLVISRELVRLSSQYGVNVVDKVPEDISGYDYRIPFFGVIKALGQNLNNITNAPYVAANWKFDGNRMGIVWSGRTQTAFTLDDFLAKLRHRRYQLFSLQKTKVSDFRVHPLEAEDFYDTAKLIEMMDHVVTVDTAVAHLAGAMGHPSVHLLLPFLMDWRWYFTQEWYPTIKTYRQVTPDNWDRPFAQLNEALRN